MLRAIVAILLVLAQSAQANHVEVHFRFEYAVQPPDVATGLLGNMTAWGIPPDGYYVVFEDADEDNVWRGSMILEEETYQYKFVSLSSVEPEVSGGYPDVTGWFPDPLNPLTDGSAYNNSILHVTDPMIYYMFPMDGSEVEDTRPMISANVTAGLETGLDLSSLIMILDGIDITDDALFDSTTGFLSFIPPSDLSLGDHTLEVYVGNSQGTGAAEVSNFAVIQGPPRMDVQFILDTGSPNYRLPVEVDRVQVAGDFNGWTPSPLRLRDLHGNGVWEGSMRFEIGKVFKYRFVINGVLWEPDPDNPVLELRDPGDWWVSVSRANPEGPPRLLDLYPLQGTILPPNQPGPALSFGVLPGDWDTPILMDSLGLSLDGTPQSVSVESSEDTVLVSFELPLLEQDVHSIILRAVDEAGRSSTAIYSFGVYQSGNGFHFVDAFGDDKGPGRYRYPEGVLAGAADIKAFHFGTSSRLNPTTVQAVVELENVDEHTAIGFLISSSLEGPHLPFPGELELLAPPLTRQGVFMWLVPPTSPFYNDSLDNRLILGIDPLRLGPPVGINIDPEETGSFLVSIPLDELELHLGTYSDEWYYNLFSVLRTDEGIEAEPTNGGWPALEDPDVYDVAFFENRESQERILGSWIASGEAAGPREVALVNSDRGLLALHPDSVAGLPQPGPEVLFYSAGSRRIWKDFSVCGLVSDQSVTSGIFHHGRRMFEVEITNGVFSVPIELRDGPNYVGLTVEDSEENSSSVWARFDYCPDHLPKARIRILPAETSVLLDGSGSFHPDNHDLVSFSWLEEPGNPAPLNLSGVSSTEAGFTLPKPPGEYAIRLVVSDGALDGNAVATVVIDSTGACALSPGDHPAWAGTELLYEIYPISYSSSSDLDAITTDMQRIKELGVGTLWLTPVCEGNEAHGYSIVDYFAVDRSLGGNDALLRLVETAHINDIKIILDLVINHTSVKHPFMVDALRYGLNSIYHDYYLWNPDGGYQSYWTDLPNLNYSNPEVWNYFLEVSQYWIENYDIDGYRCDVAWGIEERNPTFWQAWRDSIKVIKDNIILLAEASFEDNSLFEEKFDAAYDWAFLGHLRALLRNQESPSSLHQHISQMPGYGAGPLALRFLENHDETRFLSEFGPDRTILAAALLYTLPGLPLVYAGQEVGELSQRYYIDWTDPSDLQSFYGKLGAIRSDLSCLGEGMYRRIANDSQSSVYSFSREMENQRIFVAANCRAQNLTVVLDLPVDEWGFQEGETWFVSSLLTGGSEAFLTEELARFSVSLAPYEVIVVSVADSIVVDVIPKPPGSVMSLSMLPPVPNPATGPITISFTLPFETTAAISLYDIAGRRRKDVMEPIALSGGAHRLIWNPTTGAALEPGVYLVVLKAKEKSKVRPLVLLP